MIELTSSIPDTVKIKAPPLNWLSLSFSKANVSPICKSSQKPVLTVSFIFISPAGDVELRTTS